MKGFHLFLKCFAEELAPAPIFPQPLDIKTVLTLQKVSIIIPVPKKGHSIESNNFSPFFTFDEIP